MPSPDASRPQHQAAPIRTPDQLQQARRPEAPRARAAAERPADAPAPAGILGQLRSERAHD